MSVNTTWSKRRARPDRRETPGMALLPSAAGSRELQRRHHRVPRTASRQSQGHLPAWTGGS